MESVLNFLSRRGVCTLFGVQFLVEMEFLLLNVYSEIFSICYLICTLPFLSLECLFNIQKYYIFGVYFFQLSGFTYVIKSLVYISCVPAFYITESVLLAVRIFFEDELM